MKMLALGPAPADPAADDELAMALGGTPWSARPARGPGTRAALELYEAGRLADIIVASPVVPQLLRGARRARRDGQVLSLAWGSLPTQGPPVSVAFARPWPRRTTIRAGVVEVAGLAWFAIAAGRFAVVVAVHQGRRDRLRLQNGSLW
jgi:hypothetical protein